MVRDPVFSDDESRSTDAGKTRHRVDQDRPEDKCRNKRVVRQVQHCAPYQNEEDVVEQRIGEMPEIFIPVLGIDDLAPLLVPCHVFREIDPAYN